MKKTNTTMLEPYKAPTAKTIVVDLKGAFLQAASNITPMNVNNNPWGWEDDDE